jgi:hypothetical protein
MTGTEKQIKWAEDIRGANLAELDEILASAARCVAARAAKGKSTPGMSEAVAAVEAAIPALAAIDDAKWWIDHRDYNAKTNLGFATHSDEVIKSATLTDSRRFY